MNKYIYNGPVMEFDRLVQNDWHAETFANSPSKAKSNLAYHFKKATKRPAIAKISLPGTLTMID